MFGLDRGPTAQGPGLRTSELWTSLPSNSGFFFRLSQNVIHGLYLLRICFEHLEIVRTMKLALPMTADVKKAALVRQYSTTSAELPRNSGPCLPLWAAERSVS